MSRGTNDPTGSIIMILLLCSFCASIAGLGWYFTREVLKEGDECTVENGDENGNYSINSEGECVKSSCKVGYYKNDDGDCVIDQSGTICTPTSNVITNAGYITDRTGECEFTGCNIGYSLVDDSCELLETEPAPSPSPAPTTDPAADPATDPAADPDTDPAADPAADPGTETITIESTANDVEPTESNANGVESAESNANGVESAESTANDVEPAEPADFDSSATSGYRIMPTKFLTRY